MVIVFIVFPRYLAFREPCGIPRRAEIGATPTAQPPNHKDKWVPRSIVPAAQKYTHIRVNSSEAVTWNEKGNL
jgi:hypothetical protein